MDEKCLINTVVNEYTKLCKPNEKFLIKITVLVCMATTESYGSLSENFL